MSKSPASRSDQTKPYPWILKTRDIRVLWMLRILLKHGAFSSLYGTRCAGSSTRIAQRLRLPVLASFDDTGKLEMGARLAVTLELLEGRSNSIGLPVRLRENIDFLRGHFPLTKTECLVLSLAVYLRVDDDLYDVAGLEGRRINPAREIALVLGVPQREVAKALEPMGRLRRSGMIEARSGDNLAINLQLCRGGLRKLATARIRSVEELFGGFLVSAPPPTLRPDDYRHLSPGFEVLERLLRVSLARQHEGVNLLVYGSPGTGKSELARTLAQQLDVPLFDVANQDDDGEPLRASERLGSAATGLLLLGKRRAIVAFDEVEAIFNDGSDFMGKPSTAESSKAWVNHLLERNPAPVVWIANSIHRMDPAFVRRFDLVIELETPPQNQRLQLLERECGTLVAHDQLRRLSRVDCITPALITRASKVVTRVGRHVDSERLLETVIDGVLKAQGHAPLSRLLGAVDAGAFDPSLCNASENLADLAKGVATSLAGRICLYGPPGTGKTAFGRWLADTLDRPIMLKRVSDLQSPFLGVMEQKLARAFEQAARENAVLQIDEVDSFLQDRRRANRPWEASQVNEFLTQLESFEGVFIASTNLMDSLDQAAMRRFDYKIRMDYLRHEQAQLLLERNLDAWRLGPVRQQDSDRLHARKLTPGDFAVVARRHRVQRFADATAVVHALCEEADVAQRGASRRIGFI